ncbi:MAG: hypothetical protein ACXVDE_07455 [Tumebacillaceae bacterium]
MKVIFDLKNLRVTSMDNAMINVGKNWIVSRKKAPAKCEKRGESYGVERVGGDQTTGNADSRAGS